MYGGLGGAAAAAAAYCKDGGAQEAIPPPKIYRSVNCDAQRGRASSVSALLCLFSPIPPTVASSSKSPLPRVCRLEEERREEDRGGNGGGGGGVFWTVEQVNFEFALG